jgi:DNA-binding response OmpR family regulator
MTKAIAMARLLIIDDDVHVQKAVRRATEAAGFEVVQAFDGAAGLALALAERFDLILLDVSMPLMDGRDVLRKLRQEPANASVPVLIYSGAADHLARIAGLELGAADYIEKPFEAGQLVRKIQRLIEKRAEADAGRFTSAT